MRVVLEVVGVMVVMAMLTVTVIDRSMHYCECYPTACANMLFRKC